MNILNHYQNNWKLGLSWTFHLKFSIPKPTDNPTFKNDYAILNLKSVSYEDVLDIIEYYRSI